MMRTLFFDYSNRRNFLVGYVDVLVDRWNASDEEELVLRMVNNKELSFRKTCRM